jgi:selenide,water dikinase
MLEEKAVIKTANILAQLNYKASVIMREFDVSACTDVTGFGLAGHAYEMSRKNVTLEFDFDAIPMMEEAIELANMGIIPAGTYSNQEYVSLHVEAKKEHKNEIFFYDAQTSGGLLIAVRESEASRLVKRLKNIGYEYSTIVAEVKNFSGKSLII